MSYHVDLWATAVLYHILWGAKMFVCAPPTTVDLRLALRPNTGMGLIEELDWLNLSVPATTDCKPSHRWSRIRMPCGWMPHNTLPRIGRRLQLLTMTTLRRRTPCSLTIFATSMLA